MRDRARCGALRALVVAVAALTLLVPARAAATAGDVDPAFSGDGRVAITPPSDQSFVARAVAIQPDGRIVVAGFSCAPAQDADGLCLGGGGSSFRLARLTPDGGLDPEFGNGGFVTTPIGTRSQAFDVLLGPDGTILAGGLARTGGSDRFALARYGRRGDLLASTTVPVGGGFAALAALAPGPDGTVYAAGQAVAPDGRSQMAVVRLTADLAPDARWGDGGVRLGGPPYGYALGLAPAPDGAVVAAGVGGDGTTPTAYRVGALRLTPAGTPDPGFGGGAGWALFAPGTSDSFANGALAVGDGWLAAGVATGADGKQAMALLRGTPAGTLDPAFGGGAPVLVGAGDGAVANAVVAAADGRAVAIGQVATGGGWQFATARVTGAGALDPAFGAGGIATVPFDGYAVARATAGAVDDAGRLVTVGIGCAGSAQADCTGGRPVLLAARQLADPPAVTIPQTPPATPEPPKRPAPKATAKVRGVPKAVTRRRLARSGLRLVVRTTRKVRTAAALEGHRRSRGHRRFTLARATVRRYQRSFTVRLKPRRTAVRRARTGRLRVRLALRTAAGARSTRTFTVRLHGSR